MLVARFIPGVLGKEASAEEDSFADGLFVARITQTGSVEGLTVPPVEAAHENRIHSR